ncbi:MAG: hypothetical protein WBF93_09305 [Pirellulales bacterium]
MPPTSTRTESKIGIASTFALVLSLFPMIGCDQPVARGTVANADRARELRAELAKTESGDSAAKSGSGQKATGWATLRGTIKVDGEPPARTPLAIGRDANVCAPGGAPVLGEEVLVDPSTEGLANVAIYALKLDGDNVHPDAAAGKQDEVLFDQKACLFLTHVAVMQSTQKLKIVNSDPVAHNTDIKVKRSATKNVNLVPGDSFLFTPGREENEPASVSCAIHPWMRSYLLPRDNSYVAVTAADGRFEIPNLPAGIDLTIQAWHEKTGKKFVATIEGDAKWSKGRIELKGENQLVDGQTREITLVVPADELK